MALFNIKSLVSNYVRRGTLIDSLRRQLGRIARRENDPSIAMTVTELEPLWIEATDEFANQAFLQDAPRDFIPSRQQGMLEREFLSPWKYRHVVDIDFISPDGTPGITSITVNTNSENLSAQEIESNAFSEARRFSLMGGDSGIPGRSTIQQTRIVNSYANV